MKRLNTILTGGFPFYGTDIKDTLQDEFYALFKAFLNAMTSGKTEGVVIDGVNVTSAAAFDTTAGIVFLDGEFYRIDAQSDIANPSYIVPDTDVDETRVYADLATKNAIVTKKATVQGSIPGAGQYITIDSTGEKKVGLVASDEGVALRTKVIEIGDWNMDSTANVDVTHGVSKDKIRSVSVLVRDDLGIVNSPLPLPATSGSTNFNGFRVGATSVQLYRESAGIFDNANFDSTSYNRGWVTVVYEPD